MAENNTVDLIRAVDPLTEWYRGTFGALVRYRSVVTIAAVQICSGLISLGFGNWQLAVILFLIGGSVASILLMIRHIRLTRMKSEDALHSICHDIREYATRILIEEEPGAMRELIERFHAESAENIACFFKERLNDDSANVIIRIASGKNGDARYVTIARSKGLAKERWASTEPLGIDEGLAKAFTEQEGHGAYLIRNVNDAVAAKVWKYSANDALSDANTYLVCPINGYQGADRAMLGILHLTSRRNPFQPADWLPLKAFGDLLGFVYPLIYDHADVIAKKTMNSNVETELRDDTK